MPGTVAAATLGSALDCALAQPAGELGTGEGRRGQCEELAAVFLDHLGHIHLVLLGAPAQVRERATRGGDQSSARGSTSHVWERKLYAGDLAEKPMRASLRGRSSRFGGTSSAQLAAGDRWLAWTPAVANDDEGAIAALVAAAMVRIAAVQPGEASTAEEIR